MTGLFSDVRKTAVGACVLLALAVLFAEPGGVGGHAVASGTQDAPPVAPPLPEPSSHTGHGWFSAAADEPEPDITPPDPGGQPAYNAEFVGDQGGRRPTGPDFPAEVTAPRYSSSAAVP